MHAVPSDLGPKAFYNRPMKKIHTPGESRRPRTGGFGETLSTFVTDMPAFLALLNTYRLVSSATSFSSSDPWAWTASSARLASRFSPASRASSVANSAPLGSEGWNRL